MRPWIAIYSQTGNEIANLTKAIGKKPDVIVTHDNKRLKMCAELKNLLAGYDIAHYILPSKIAIEDYRRIFKNYNDPLITCHGFLKIIPKEVCKTYEMYNGHPGLVSHCESHTNLDDDNTTTEIMTGLDAQELIWKNNTSFPVVGSFVHRVEPEVDGGKIVSLKLTKNTSKTKEELYTLLKKTSLDSWINFFKIMSMYIEEKSINEGESGPQPPNFIEIAENTYPDLCAEFKKLQAEDYQLFCMKQYDYGLDNISVGSSLVSEEDKRVSQCSIIFRMMEKVQRLKNLVIKKNQTSPANEPIEDAYRDLTNFGIIARIVKRGKWK